MKYRLLLFIALTLTACKKDKETLTNSKPVDSLTISQDSAKAGSSSDSGKILVEIFPFPKEIKECSCYFARNRADFEAEKYIYADDAGKTAYMKLDGQRLILNLISSNDLEVDDELSKEIENENYKISVKGKKIKSEEALLFEGTLTIEKADGTTVSLPIYGECGC
ncbi:hypothetical protein HNP38_003103 [Chryseobacterium defluvii]|uniref:Uncharacterized protein n=1 Tax=Chryseobacterium defluvii TaxID=160396 RepID=A0A840KIN0_9FLAO|nr:hypothetical protein [Chryseobacterium defluvii]MBB4807787.1 hypothetical protein [Chryseobacterium defluvii]